MLTIHDHLFLHCHAESLRIPKLVHSQNMEPNAAVETLDGPRIPKVLYNNVGAHCTSTIPNEGMGLFHTLPVEEVMEEVL